MPLNEKIEALNNPALTKEAKIFLVSEIYKSVTGFAML